MNFDELAKEYRLSIKLLNRRIAELTEEKLKLHTNIPRRKQSASEIEEREEKIAILDIRLKPLISMRNELALVAREVAHYYDLSWWRSPDYTMNCGKGVKYTYGE